MLHFERETETEMVSIATGCLPDTDRWWPILPPPSFILKRTYTHLPGKHRTFCSSEDCVIAGVWYR